MELDQLSKRMNEVKRELQSRSESLQSEYATWLERQSQAMTDSSWRLPDIQKADAHRQKLKIEKDLTILASGENPANDTYEITLVPDGSVRAIRLDVLQHESMTKKGLSRADSGNFVLTSLELFRESKSQEGKKERTQVAIADARATFEQGAHTIKTAFDEDRRSGWAVWEGRVVDRPMLLFSH